MTVLIFVLFVVVPVVLAAVFLKLKVAPMWRKEKQEQMRKQMLDTQFDTAPVRIKEAALLLREAVTTGTIPAGMQVNPPYIIEFENPEIDLNFNIRYGGHLQVYRSDDIERFDLEEFLTPEQIKSLTWTAYEVINMTEEAIQAKEERARREKFQRSFDREKE